MHDLRTMAAFVNVLSPSPDLELGSLMKAIVLYDVS